MDAAGLMTLTDVAHLADVQRPVVSMWRSRSRNSALPFPAAAAQRADRELFEARAVCDWLVATGRGNNPNIHEDAAAFVSGAREDFPAVSTLLALSAIAGEPLSGRDFDDLLDLADETDPDDDFLYREVEEIRAAEALTGYVTRLADAAYSPAAAFELLMDDRFRTGMANHANTALAPELRALVADAVVAMSLATGAESFWEATPGGSDLALAVSAALGEGRSADLGVAPGVAGRSAEDTQRFAARRLRVHLSAHGHHGWARTYDGDAHGAPRIVVAQFPGPGLPDADGAGILRAVDEIALSMGETDGALVVAPARWLVDSLSGELESARSQILRTGRVRAAVRLPAGLVPARIRQPMAVWVLSSASGDVPVAERRTMTADLTNHHLDTAGQQDLVSDIAASLGDRLDYRAHAFRFGALVRTSHILASSGPVTGAGVRAPRAISGPRDPADYRVRAERLLDELRSQSEAPSAAGQPDIGFQAGKGEPVPRATLGELISAGDLAYLPGTRIDASDITHDGGAGLRVIGADAADGPGRIDPLLLASRYPRARLTEPGDVVFRTSPTAAAVVDWEGSSVAPVPNRILRVRGRSLLPDPLAADLARNHGQWRRWSVRRFDPDDAPSLAGALNSLRSNRAELLERLHRLDQLTTLLTDGVAQGALHVTDSPEGHR